MDEASKVSSLVGALAVQIDARRWTQIADLFGTEVRVDYSSLFGGDAETMTRQGLMERWQKLLPGFTSTTHIIGTPTIVFSERKADVFASVVAWHRIKDLSLGENDLWLVGGCYEISCEKLDDGEWRITSLTLARAWAEGNLDLPRIAGERVGQGAVT